VPGSSTHEFTLLRRDKLIAAKLKETYALPGIISDNTGITGASGTTFVYKLGKDSRVTIRVYDFNMQHVRTVIENAPRKAATATGRSTDSKSDVWDGTTSSGRVVAPGVYYYKITTSSGERSFGKIVVAKGPAR
jgi:flagellar hook assembly protein FlgD